MIPTPQFFRVLADRTRLRIVNLLARGPLCVCDIQSMLRQPQSSVSRHLALLRTAGLVRDRRDGMRIFYEVTDWGDGLRRDVLDSLRRNLKAEAEHARDLATLDARRAAGWCHVEGAEAAPRRAAKAGVTRAVPRLRNRRAGSRRAES